MSGGFIILSEMKNNFMNSENISFKKVSPDDWQKFRDIRLNGLQNDPQAFGGVFENESQESEVYWRERFSNPERLFYVAEENGLFVATAGSKKIDEDNWMITAVYVLPEYRGKHISEALVNQIIVEVKNLGAKKASLMVNAVQEGAVYIYKKMGFETVKTEKEQKFGDGKTYDVYYMEKII